MTRVDYDYILRIPPALCCNFLPRIFIFSKFDRCITTCMLRVWCVLGPLAGGLTDRYGCRLVTISGSVLAAGSLVISSFSPHVNMLIATYGLLAGDLEVWFPFKRNRLCWQATNHGCLATASTEHSYWLALAFVA